MSYSFNIFAVSAAAAAIAVAAKLDETVAQQPIHEADKDQAQAATEQLLGLLREPAENEHISVSVSGSVSKYRAEDEGFNNVSLSVHANVTQKPADKPVDG
jgi:membrane protein implicated in regulation of membrane protease activity